MKEALKGNWFAEVFKDQQAFALRVDKELYRNQSPYQDIFVFENRHFGRVLTLDGTYQLSELDEHMYHRALTTYAMQNLPSAQNLRVLVIGAGDGAIVRDLLQYWGSSIHSITMVEIDREVIDISKRFFPQLASALEDPKLELRVQDAIKYIEETADAEFDLILCDSTDPVGFAAGLIELDFYRQIRRILKPNGIYCCQSGSPIFQREEYDKCRANLAKVFPELHSYYAPMIVYPGTLWSYTAAGAKISNRSNIDIGEFIEKSAQSIHSRSQLQQS